MDRYRLPRWGNALIDLIADHPMSLPGRLAAMRMGRPAPRGTVPTTTFADRPKRVLIAPVNYSGQAHEWARALEAFASNVSARNMAVDVPGGFSYDSDLVVAVSTYHNDTDWQRRQFESASHATHVLIEACEAPFGRLFGRSVQAQAEALMDRGVSVAFLGHGTEIRLPSKHLAENPWSQYSDPTIYTPRLQSLAERNIQLIAGSARPQFVSTPDLLLDLPEAHWCPVVVDVERWAAPHTERVPGAPIRVAHAPSVAAIKGTELIAPVLAELQTEGIIEVDLIQGVPSAEMPQRFSLADVVIDQFRIGSYGAAACEAMASGCVVIGHVSDRVRGIVAEQTGRSLPIVEATPDTIEDVLRELATRGDLGDVREAGRAFVRAVHDGQMSAATLSQHWIDDDKDRDPEPEHDASSR